VRASRSALFYLATMFKHLSLMNEKILLRRPQEEDIPTIFSAVQESLPDLHPWMDWATESYSLQSTKNWFEHTCAGWSHATAYQFIIADISNTALLGILSIDGIDEKEKSCNLGYWVRSKQRGKGIANQAIRLAAEFAIKVIGMVRAEIVIASPNTASQRAAIKAGAHAGGKTTNQLVVRTDVYDAEIYFFSKDDFPGHSDI
jgi:ribosomal-protein-serine acetyltransferase